MQNISLIDSTTTGYYAVFHNVPPGYTRDHLKKLCDDFGSILRVHVNENKAGSLLGRVDFKDRDSAICAVKSLNGHVLNGWRLDVEYLAKTRRKDLPRHIFEINDFIKAYNVKPPGGQTVYMCKIWYFPPNVLRCEVEKLVKHLGGILIDSGRFIDPRRNACISILVFKHLDSAIRVVERVKGFKLKVNDVDYMLRTELIDEAGIPPLSSSERILANKLNTALKGVGKDAVPHDVVLGFSEQYLSSESRERAGLVSVCIKKLYPAIIEKELYDVFKSAGSIAQIYIKPCAKLTEFTNAFIRFRNAVSAQEALKLSGVSIQEQIIEVEIANESKHLMSKLASTTGDLPQMNIGQRIKALDDDVDDDDDRIDDLTRGFVLMIGNLMPVPDKPALRLLCQHYGSIVAMKVARPKRPEYLDAMPRSSRWRCFVQYNDVQNVTDAVLGLHGRIWRGCRLFTTFTLGARQYMRSIGIDIEYEIREKTDDKSNENRKANEVLDDFALIINNTMPNDSVMIEKALSCFNKPEVIQSTDSNHCIIKFASLTLLLKAENSEQVKFLRRNQFVVSVSPDCIVLLQKMGIRDKSEQ